MLGLVVSAHPSTPLGRGRGVVVGMLGCFLIGLLWICTFYVFSDDTRAASRSSTTSASTTWSSASASWRSASPSPPAGSDAGPVTCTLTSRLGAEQPRSDRLEPGRVSVYAAFTTLGMAPTAVDRM